MDIGNSGLSGELGTFQVGWYTNSSGYLDAFIAHDTLFRETKPGELPPLLPIGHRCLTCQTGLITSIWQEHWEFNPIVQHTIRQVDFI